MIGLVIFREFVSVRAVSSSGIFSRRAGTLSMVKFMEDLPDSFNPTSHSCESLHIQYLRRA